MIAQGISEGWMQVHPRIRGEYINNEWYCVSGTGSPPHPRGICTVIITRCICIRFTPASAGNIQGRYSEKYTAKVHPRIRGEYYKPQNMMELTSGSPPHPRGIYCRRGSWLYLRRFTPASAGNMLDDNDMYDDS